MVAEAVRRLAAAPLQQQIVTAHTAREAAARVSRAVADGAAAVVAVGGDGTVHAGLQAVAGASVPFGVVPTGGGNDFARVVGVPTDPGAAADAVVRALVTDATRAWDLGCLTTRDGRTRWFGTVLAAGFDALVNERANRLRWPRGRLRYDLAIGWELARLRPRHYVLRLDGRPLEREAVLVAVGNTPCYGGGIRICPRADPTDGYLDVMIGRAPISRLALARLRPRATRGTHLDDPRVEYHRVRQLEIDTPELVTYADGEQGMPLPLSVSCVPGALRLLG